MKGHIVNEQQWEEVVFRKGQANKSLSTERVQVCSGGMPKATQNVLSDDTVPPEQIDKERVKKLVSLRMHLKLKMEDMSKRCSIPLAEYRDIENGKLIKTKATQHLNKIFRIFRKELESMQQ